LTRLYKSSNCVANDGAVMAPVSSPVGYICTRMSTLCRGARRGVYSAKSTTMSPRNTTRPLR
jgi:hypothetical protein